MKLELVTLILLAWGVMTSGLALLPAVLGRLVDEPWPLVIAWAIVSLAWIPVDAVMRHRLSPLARFSINLPLWIAAALCGFWVRGALGLT